MYSKTYDLPPQVIQFLKKDVRKHVDVGNSLSKLDLSFFSRGMLNTFFRQMGLDLTVEYAILFTWKAGDVQPLHIDGTPPASPRNASLNLIIKGGEEAQFEWYDAEITEETRTSASGVPSFVVKDSTATLVHREHLQKCAAVLTNVPHRVANITTDTHLLCIRMRDNPTLDKF